MEQLGNMFVEATVLGIRDVKTEIFIVSSKCCWLKELDLNIFYLCSSSKI